MGGTRRRSPFEPSQCLADVQFDGPRVGDPDCTQRFGQPTVHDDDVGASAGLFDPWLDDPGERLDAGVGLDPIGLGGLNGGHGGHGRRWELGPVCLVLGDRVSGFPISEHHRDLQHPRVDRQRVDRLTPDGSFMGHEHSLGAGRKVWVQIRECVVLGHDLGEGSQRPPRRSLGDDSCCEIGWTFEGESIPHVLVDCPELLPPVDCGLAVQAQVEEIFPRSGCAESVDCTDERVGVGEVDGVEHRFGERHPGSGPVAIGLLGSADQSLHDPSYSTPPSTPASSIASRLWQAVTPLPQ